MSAVLGKVARSAVTVGLFVCCLLASGCSGQQSSLDPAGVQADRISQLWWLYFWVCLFVYVAVIAVIFLGVARRRERQPEPAPPLTLAPAAQERRLTRAVVAGVAVTVLTLFLLLAGDFVTGRELYSLNDPDALVIEVKAHQWWWEVRYHDPTPGNMFSTGNEIHIPVGRAIRFDLQSADVIHSFWVPNLHGKRDIIPGRKTRIFLRADQPGTFWGQCAEYCGYQHATMRFVVVAEPENEFEKWAEAQRQPAPGPETESQKKGLQVFLTRTCVMCHTIQGTPAQGKVGPDLTHLASRPKIASGTLLNTRGHLAGWILDPQKIRPGVHMPLNPLEPDELHALLDYLETLK
jgi:cytochrome c oxidase subunit II